MRLDRLIRRELREALKAHGGKVSPACLALGISRQTYYNWQESGVRVGVGFKSRKIESLIREHCRHVLRKHEYRRRYGMVKGACREMGIPISTFYTWAESWGWLKFGKIQFESVKSRWERERRKVVEGTGRVVAAPFGTDRDNWQPEQDWSF